MTTEPVQEPDAPEITLPQTFVVEPYRPDGGWTFGGIMQMFGCVGLAAIVLGAIASFVSQFFYLVLIFSIFIGFAIGKVGEFCIRRFGIRRPLACGMAGFLGGILATLMMQYFDYQRFESELAHGYGEALPAARDIARNFEEAQARKEELPQELQDFITDLEENPEYRRALLVDSFPSYVDFAAVQGVSIGGKVGRQGDGLNLGYAGTYIYWGVETLIIAGIAFSFMRTVAADPYCPECQTWKTKDVWGPFDNPENVRATLTEGTLSRFPGGADSESGDMALISGFRCPECQDAGTIDVLAEKLQPQKDGNVVTRKIAFMTYPGTAWKTLVLACSPPSFASLVLAESELEESEEDDELTEDEAETAT